MARQIPAGVGRNKRRRTAMLLWAVVVAANLLGLFVAVYGAAAVRALPDPSTEVMIRFAYFTVMLLVGVADALWVDEVIFKGSFRKTHLQGKSARFAKKDADVGELAATMQRSNISFPVSVVGCTMLTYMLFNYANHDFDPYYRMVGKHVLALRSSEPELATERREAIDTLSIRQRAEVLPILVHQLDRGGEVAAWSAWAIGRHRESPIADRAVRPLVAAAREGEPALRREALLSLSRFQHRAIAPEIRKELAGELERDEVDLRLLWALAYLQTPESLDVLEKALYQGDETVQRVAAWAIAQHRDQRGGRRSVELLEQRLPAASHLVQCSIVHSLGVLADENSNLALMRAWGRLSDEERGVACPAMSIYLRPDGKSDRFDLLIPTETYGMKTLQAMGQMRATTPAIRGEVEPWLEAVKSDDGAATLLREAAGSLLTGIQQGRNDRGAEGS